MPYSREEMREYMRAYRERRMADARQRLGGCCANCGSTEDLHFDHIDPASKAKAITQLLHASRARFEAELAKCQLLCGDCHRVKTRAGKEIHHKLTQDQADELRHKAAAGMSQRALAAEYGIHQSTAWSIIHERTYRAVA
jgi:5-methylcytosine-specific restriction endonuclease McrA